VRSKDIITCRTPVGDQVLFSRHLTTEAPPGSPGVVLVHGFVVSGRYMVPTMHALAPFCRVYTPDLPGWGKSTKPVHSLPITDLADILAAWVHVLGLQKSIFLGNSMGCQIVAEMAVRHPDVATALILLGPTVDPKASTLLRQALRLARDIPRERPSLWVVELRDLLHMRVPRALATARAMIDNRIEVNLSTITIPTLVVRGSRDPIAPLDWTEAATRLLANGRLALVMEAGHAANYSAPSRLVKAILPFIHEVTRVSMRRKITRLLRRGAEERPV
jgi:2-hydroxy-6-oxonona-2,4-dienedioate hydrolase